MAETIYLSFGKCFLKMRNLERKKQLRTANLEDYFLEFLKWYGYLRSIISIARILYRILVYVKSSSLSLRHSDEAVYGICLALESAFHYGPFARTTICIPLNSMQDVLGTDYTPESIQNPQGFLDVVHVVTLNK